MNVYHPRSVVEYLQFTVKRVVVFLGDGEEGVGTGYVFETLPKEERVIRFLVVNAHLIDGATSAKVLMHTAVRKDGKLVPTGANTFLKIDISEQNIVYHPDYEIDLAAILIGSYTSAWQASAKPDHELFYLALSPENLASASDLEGVEPTTIVTMVGCPEGLWDDVNGFPLFRRGFLASTPSIDYQGRPEFALDILVFSGSSGSPIFLIDPPTNRLRSLKLLGTLWGSPQVSPKGEVSNEDVPISTHGSVDDRGRSHIGLAIKAEQLLALSAAVEKFVEDQVTA